MKPLAPFHALLRRATGLANSTGRPRAAAFAMAGASFLLALTALQTAPLHAGEGFIDLGLEDEEPEAVVDPEAKRAPAAPAGPTKPAESEEGEPAAGGASASAGGEEEAVDDPEPTTAGPAKPAGPAKAVAVRYTPLPSATASNAAAAPAMEALKAKAPAEELATAFQAARKGGAVFGDGDAFALAVAFHEAKRFQDAYAALSLMSSEARASAQATALRLDLDLGKPPKIEPTLWAATLVGGTGKQAITKVGFTNDGRAYGKGNGFTIYYDLETGEATVEGDINQNLAEKPSKHHMAGHPKQKRRLEDPRFNQNYMITTKQVHPLLQQPVLYSSAGWTLWNSDYVECYRRSLMADSRGYGVWLMPAGQIMAMVWADGGNTRTLRDPQDIDKKEWIVQKGWKPDAGGLAVLYTLIDAATGEVTAATYVNEQPYTPAVDPWGRIYFPNGLKRKHSAEGPVEQVGMRGRAGASALSADLSATEMNTTLGGMTPFAYYKSPVDGSMRPWKPRRKSSRSASRAKSAEQKRKEAEEEAKAKERERRKNPFRDDPLPSERKRKNPFASDPIPGGKKRQFQNDATDVRGDSEKKKGASKGKSDGGDGRPVAERPQWEKGMPYPPWEELYALDIRGNVLVLGGSSAAESLKAPRQHQTANGGDQDGLFIILKLWDDPK